MPGDFRARLGIHVVEQRPPNLVRAALFVPLTAQLTEYGCIARIVRAAQEEEAFEEGGLPRIVSPHHQIDSAKSIDLERPDSPKILRLLTDLHQERSDSKPFWS